VKYETMKKKATVSLQLYNIFLFLLYAVCFIFLVWFAINLYNFFNDDDKTDMIAVELLKSEIEQAIYVQKKWDAAGITQSYESVFPLSFASDKQIFARAKTTLGIRSVHLCLWSKTGKISLKTEKEIACEKLPKEIRYVNLISYNDHKVKNKDDLTLVRTLIHPIPVLTNYKLKLEKVTDRTYGINNEKMYDITIEYILPTANGRQMSREEVDAQILALQKLAESLGND
jgi:hypothetical protein